MEKIKLFIIAFCLISINVSGYTGNSITQECLTDCPEVKQQLVEKIYTSQIGIRESIGHNDGFKIRQYLAVTGFDQPVPWCAAFVSWVYTLSDVDTPQSAWSPAWFTDTYTIYVRGHSNLKTPRKGDVFGLYFTKYGRIAHVGFIHDWPPGKYCTTVEGNTNASGSREGDGVYKKKRLKSQIYKVARYI